jgi:two-component system KDP operon response regulator KdpE
MPKARVLVIEDEEPIRRFLSAALVDAGYEVTLAATGTHGLTLAADAPPDLVILDLGLPDQDGKTVLSRLRDWSSMPVIVLSARDQEREKVAALDAGADDYCVKPFAVGELLARLRVALRHHGIGAPDGTAIVVGDFRLDLASRRVFVAGREVHLTPLEFKLVSVLARSAGSVLTHRTLLREVWGPGNAHEVHYLRVFVAGLRRKLEADPTRPRLILTEQGIGYRFADPGKP